MGCAGDCLKRFGLGPCCPQPQGLPVPRSTDSRFSPSATLAPQECSRPLGKLPQPTACHGPHMGMYSEDRHADPDNHLPSRGQADARPTPVNCPGAGPSPKPAGPSETPNATRMHVGTHAKANQPRIHILLCPEAGTPSQPRRRPQQPRHRPDHPTPALSGWSLPSQVSTISHVHAGMASRLSNTAIHSDRRVRHWSALPPASFSPSTEPFPGFARPLRVVGRDVYRLTPVSFR
jgi:hypothetical protein